MDFIKRHKLTIIIISAILIRLILLFLDFSFDVHNHIAWGKDLMNRGFAGFFETRSSEVYASPFPNYPPLINFIFYILYLIYSGIVKAEWWLNTHLPAYPSKLVFFIESRTFAAGIFKLPAILADFGIAWICYLFAKKITPKKSNLKAFIFAFVLLNPAYFYNSAFWGQIDSIPIFFALAAFYLLWYTKRSVSSALLFTLGLLVKPTIIVFLPLYIFIFFRNYPKREVFKAGVISIVLFWISFLPFYKTGNLLVYPFEVYNKKILEAQSLAFVTNGAYNIWLLFTWFRGIKDTASLAFGLSYRFFGYVLTSISFILIFFTYLKRKSSVEMFFFAALMMSYSSFMFLTKMHERYSMLMLPFFLILAIQNRKMLKWYVVFSLISFLNLAHSWQAIKIPLFIMVINYVSVSIFLAFCNTVLFTYLFKIYLSNEKKTLKEESKNNP